MLFYDVFFYNIAIKKELTKETGISMETDDPPECPPPIINNTLSKKKLDKSNSKFYILIYFLKINI